MVQAVVQRVVVQRVVVQRLVVQRLVVCGAGQVVRWCTQSN